ncbi:DUF1552 domain-containing protein [Hyalangium rubrum]|uniref:DUF1552 domain-containing protein n=1 Tax=Hyalangium rubrum TaxID=3103134 RepID=A0ABU5H7E6_9BACT|nr:DUF1552 domain-containing protein [Hyalangium sp. s54d21]MDY7227995.1 DUF1552 domain-containing protein [Hyalangium sp. s54d21]
MKKPWELSRRTFLRGAGTLLGLPVLEAMVPSIARAQASGALPPRRMMAFYVPNGMYPPEWYPTNTGADYTLSPLLSPLAAFKSDMLVLSGLGNKPSHYSSNVDVGHVASTATFLTAVPAGDAPVRNGISLDQFAANQLKAHTRFPSLELGTRGGTSDVLHNNISWTANGTPMPKETRPDHLFDRLFEGMDPNQSAQEAEARRRRRLSVLDSAREDTTRLQSKLGQQDRLRMEEYLTGVRELEVRLQQTRPSQCSPGARPSEPTDVRQQVRLLLDVMVLAFQCDLTRVATFMYGEAVDDSSYNFLSIPDGRGGSIPISQGHHTLSHDISAGSQSQRMYSAICKWEVEQFAYLLSKMKAVQEPDGTLLDNSVVLFGSNIGEAQVHDTLNMPVVLAGRGGGKVRPGRHILYKNPNDLTPGVPVARLFLSMLQAVGVTATSFGSDGTAPLLELT